MTDRPSDIAPLAVIGGQFDLATAAAVLGEPEGPTVAVGLLLETLVDQGAVVSTRVDGRPVYSLHRSAVRAAGPFDEEAARRLGHHLVATLGDRPDDGHWLAEVGPRLESIVAAVDDLVALDPALAARLALIVCRYHRRRSAEASIIDRLAAWVDWMPPSDETRLLVADLATFCLFAERLAEAAAWCDRHAAMTEALGRPCSRQPTILLRSSLAIVAGDTVEGERLCLAGLAQLEDGDGDGIPAMFAHGNLSAALGLQGRFDEGAHHARVAMQLAAEHGEMWAVEVMASNLVGLAIAHHGYASQARNILQWVDSPVVDPVGVSVPRLIWPAAWVAVELGRYEDAARLARLVAAVPPPNLLHREGTTPDDLVRLLRDLHPKALTTTADSPLLSPTEAVWLARAVLTDPGLPPQAEPIGLAAVDPEPVSASLPREVLAGPLLVLPGQEQARVLAVGKHRRWRRGDRLSGDVQVIVSGWVGHQAVTVAGEVAIVDVAGAGEVVGDPSPLPPGLAVAVDAVALGPVETLALPAPVLAELRRRYPAFQEALVELLVSRVHRLEGAVTDALFLPVEERVVHRLADLARRSCSPGPVHLAITQDELASMVGSTRPTINRVLRRMEADGQVQRSRGVITVPAVSRGSTGRRPPGSTPR